MSIDMFLQMSSSFKKGNITQFPEISVSCDQIFEGLTPLSKSVGQPTNKTILFFLFEAILSTIKVVI